MEERDLDLITRHLEGTLSPAEAEEVAHRLATEPAFARRRQLVEESERALRLPTEAFRDTLAAVMAEEEVPARPVRRLWWPYAVAAGLALLIAIGLGWYAQRARTPDWQALYASHFSPPPSPFLLRDASPDPADVSLFQGATAYEAQAYAEAAQAWTQVPDTHPQAAVAQLYTGISWLAAGEAARAIERLEALAQSDADPSVRATAQWYLALAWLRRQDPVQARPWLEQLAAQPGAYASRAQALLAQMGG